jgi:hypothetical protein
MARPKIDAKEALDSIRSGLDDQALMEKYGISAKGLQSLFNKLLDVGAISSAELEKRVSESLGNVNISRYVSELSKSGRRGRGVNARQAASDIRSGMSDAALMEKFKLSAKGLQSLFDQLVVAGLLTQSEIDERATWVDSTVDLMGILKNLGLDRTSKRRASKPAALNRCPACGAPQTMEFDECPLCGVNISEFTARPPGQRKSTPPAWVCPACGRAQDRAHEECPICGVIVSKLEQRMVADRKNGR